jgi:hypothetical protein
MATVPTLLTKPIRVADLPLPSDVAEEVEQICRAKRLTGRKRTDVEEDIKLRHHYAGHIVVATADLPGLQIHSIDLENPDEVHELKKRLHAQGYRYVYTLVPIPWKDWDVTIVTLNPES